MARPKDYTTKYRAIKNVIEQQRIGFNEIVVFRHWHQAFREDLLRALDQTRYQVDEVQLDDNHFRIGRLK